MSENKQKYRLLSFFLIALTSTLLVVQVICAVFNNQNEQDASEKDESSISAQSSEAILPVVVLPFCKVIFTSLLSMIFLLLLHANVVIRTREKFSIFNVQILGSICMNGP